MTREEALKELDVIFIPKNDNQRRFAEAVGIAIKALKAEPTVRHIREGEHWIEWHNSTTDYGVKCSYCDGYAIDEEGYFFKTPYCPWCGSKMEVQNGKET